MKMCALDINRKLVAVCLNWWWWYGFWCDGSRLPARQTHLPVWKVPGVFGRGIQQRSIELLCGYFLIKGHEASPWPDMKLHCIQGCNQDTTCLVSVLEMLYVLCCDCDKLSCLSNVHSSAQTLLLACSFELHPVTTLSPVPQPWQPNHHTLSSKDTGYNMQSISVAASACSPSTLLCSLSETERPY